MESGSLFSKRLLEERKRLDLDQAAAGAKAGVSREMWGKYERGMAVMGTNVLMSFAANTEADVLYILTGERSGGAAKYSRRALAMADNYDHCPPAVQDTLDAAVAAWQKQDVKQGKAA